LITTDHNEQQLLGVAGYHNRIRQEQQLLDEPT
jgi:hypothetical protein